MNESTKQMIIVGLALFCASLALLGQFLWPDPGEKKRKPKHCVDCDNYLYEQQGYANCPCPCGECLEMKQQEAKEWEKKWH